MLKRVPFGPLAPDLPPADQLIIAKNAYPSSTGYGPVGAFNAITPALPSINGGGAFISSTGETSFLAGTSSDLYRFSGGAWDSVFDDVVAPRWRFAQFGDIIVSVFGSFPVSYRALSGEAGYTPGNPPKSDLVAVVRDFVVVAGDPESIQTVTWSGNNRSDWWPATNPTAVDQYDSDAQELLSGGEVMGLAGGEYGIILQKYAVKRMTFQGGDTIFSFDEIASNVGCMAKGSVAQSGRLVFFLSERGFMVCDGNDVQPIGEEQVDETFFRTYARQDIVDGLYAAVDPTRNVVMWAMPGSLGQIWCYSWPKKRWTTIETDTRLIFAGFTANVSLDTIGDIDALTVSLDDPVFAGGNPLLLVATTDGTVGTLAGVPMDGTFRVARMSFGSDRVRIRSARPVTDSPDVLITIQGRARSSALPLVEQSGEMRRNGEVPLRVNAQEIVLIQVVRAPWSYCQGVDIEYEGGGRR